MNLHKLIYHKKKTISVDEIKDMHPCMGYSPSVLRKLFNNKKRVSVSKLLALDLQHRTDIFWLLLHFFDTPTLKKIGYAAYRSSGQSKPKIAWDYDINFYTEDEDKLCLDEKEFFRHCFFWTSYDILEDMVHRTSRKKAMKILKKYLKREGLIK